MGLAAGDTIRTIVAPAPVLVVHQIGDWLTGPIDGLISKGRAQQ